jgi:myo-inositol-1(or 4)-monophosphatase
MEEIKEVALAAVRVAGEVLIREYENFDRKQAKFKAHQETVTRGDLLSEEIIINTIRKNFPSHGIVSEEKGIITGYDKYIWYIDPIDGTTNFSMHNPLWAISLAVAEEGELILGVIFAPLLDELYLAIKDEGAYFSNVYERSKFKKINVSDVSVGKILNTFCSGRKPADIKRAIAYYRRQKAAGHNCAQFGSAALELAYVASGRVESFVAPGANDWDVAAGAILVKEAGGRVTDFKNRPWGLGRGDILASNGLVHGQTLKVINS